MADIVIGHTSILINDLTLRMFVGAYAHERDAHQPVILNLSARVAEAMDWQADRLENTVCYDTVVQNIQKLAASQHFALLETLGYHIAELLLADDRVLDVALRLEKPEAIPETRSVGIEIKRARR